MILNMHILMHRLALDLIHITDYTANYHITPHSVSFTKLIHIEVYICGAIIVLIYNKCAQISCLWSKPYTTFLPVGQENLQLSNTYNHIHMCCIAVQHTL